MILSNRLIFLSAKCQKLQFLLLLVAASSSFPVCFLETIFSISPDKKTYPLSLWAARRHLITTFSTRLKQLPTPRFCNIATNTRRGRRGERTVTSPSFRSLYWEKVVNSGRFGERGRNADEKGWFSCNYGAPLED